MLFPSSGEGFGIVILESWFNKKPVISFDVPAPNEIITHMKDGIIVTPFSTKELLKAILFMIDNPVKTAELGTSGNNNYIENYTSKIMVERSIKNYNQVCG